MIYGRDFEPPPGAKFVKPNPDFALLFVVVRFDVSGRAFELPGLFTVLLPSPLASGPVLRVFIYRIIAKF
jgi:hypothetical protein